LQKACSDFIFLISRETIVIFTPILFTTTAKQAGQQSEQQRWFGVSQETVILAKSHVTKTVQCLHGGWGRRWLFVKPVPYNTDPLLFRFHAATEQGEQQKEDKADRPE
jgi:poly(3-hydroxybutyrate) depolymerase